MKRIPLSATSGEPRAYALVDDEDYERFGHLAWTLSVNRGISYANRSVGGRVVYLHRAICRLVRGDGKVVDHVNGDGLDNRRENLKVGTQADNARNRRDRTFGTSRYRGVYWNKRQQKWFARAKVNYRHVWLGAFDDEDAAGEAVAAFWRDFDASREGLAVFAKCPDEDTVEFEFSQREQAA